VCSTTLHVFLVGMLYLLYNLYVLFQVFSSLGDNMIIKRDQITVIELLGEGTYAKVFKVTLTQNNAPITVSQHYNCVMLIF